MANLDPKHIGAIVRLVGYKLDPDKVLEGALRELEMPHDRIWAKARIDEEWVYLSDWGFSDILELEGKRLPVAVGVYRLDPAHFDEKFAQVDEKGQWWPFPYSFSGWRNSELLLHALPTIAPELSVDYPAIRDPEEAERAQVKSARKLRKLRKHAEIWDEAIVASGGDQAAENPYYLKLLKFSADTQGR